MQNNRNLTSILIIFLVTLSCTSKEKTVRQDNERPAATVSRAASNTALKGQVLHTTNYDITVDSLELLESIKGEFESLPGSSDAGYLVVHITYKNTSNSSIEPSSGSIVIADGDDFKEYSQAEAFVEHGFTVMDAPIGPGLTTTIKYVYRIPKTARGTIYYLPEKEKPTQMIASGEI